MGAYENGMGTRRMILDACKKLFYEKGFHDTSYDDICREAHVNRGSIYYHFKEKENIRYEVIWEYTMRNCNDAKQYCDDPVYQPSVGMYFLWYQLYYDPKMCRFCIEYFEDYPAYAPQNSLARYYKTLWSYLYKDMWNGYCCDYLPFAALYGYIMGLIHLARNQPAGITPLELCRQCFTAGNMIGGIPGDAVSREWDIIAGYIEKIPVDAMEKLYRFSEV